ncbi:MAG: hypothetical protein AAFR96_09370 [Planctomycetota bacterium]
MTTGSIGTLGAGRSLPEVGRTVDRVIERVNQQPVGVGAAGVRVVQDAGGASLGLDPGPGAGIRYLDATIAARRLVSGGSVGDMTPVAAGESVEYQVRLSGAPDPETAYREPINRFHRNGPYYAAPIGGHCRIKITFDESGEVDPQLILESQEQIGGAGCPDPA